MNHRVKSTQPHLSHKQGPSTAKTLATQEIYSYTNLQQLHQGKTKLKETTTSIKESQENLKLGQIAKEDHLKLPQPTTNTQVKQPNTKRVVKDPQVN